MAKNILIVSSDFTGHGHKSITESLSERFSENDDIKLHVIDGFSLGGKPLIQVAKSYGTITRNVEGLWEIIWDISSIKPTLINEIIEITIKEQFLKLVNKINPDLILSVHPNFNGSIINILKKNNIKIPVVTLIADLVSITPLWADSRADFVISPTEEARKRCIEFGVPDEKIKVMGFPVRKRFYNNVQNIGEKNLYTFDKPLNCLIMSGGEGVGNMRKIAEIVLNNFNATVKIVAGRNKALKRKLELSLGEKYGDRVEIYGFTENIQELMMASDIAFTRGSPNVMMEAIACNVPLVITGSLPGQEEENPKFAELNKLGVVCKKVKDIKPTIEYLLSDNAYRLNEIKYSQKKFSNIKVAKNITDFLINVKVPSSEFKIHGLVENLGI